MSFIHLLARDGELKLCDVILILLGIYSFPLVMGCVLILHRLYDALLKRYPFRQIPLMPPKRLALNGHYLSTEADFIERRRRGLSRFMNSIVRHPVLRDDDIVVAFITVPTVFTPDSLLVNRKELSIWRKSASIPLVEQFTDRE